MDCSLIMTKRINVTSTFLTYCHICHLHRVLQAAPIITYTHTQTHTYRHTQVILLTARQSVPEIFTLRMPACVTDCLSDTPGLILSPPDLPHPPLFIPPHISAMTAEHAYGHVLHTLHIIYIVFSSSSYLFILIDWFVSYGSTYNGMCLFSAFSVKLDVEATLNTNHIYVYKNRKKRSVFPSCGG